MAARWTRGLSHRPFKSVIAGSNPARATISPTLSPEWCKRTSADHSTSNAPKSAEGTASRTVRASLLPSSSAVEHPALNRRVSRSNRLSAANSEAKRGMYEFAPPTLAPTKDDSRPFERLRWRPAEERPVSRAIRSHEQKHSKTFALPVQVSIPDFFTAPRQRCAETTRPHRVGLQGVRSPKGGRYLSR